MNKRLRFLAGLFFLACLSLPTASAWATTAGTAANTQIINTATLSSNGVVVASSSVTVTVALVPGQPNVTIGHTSGTYSGPNTPVLTDSIVVLSTANGPASYTVTPSVSASSNTSAPSVGTPPATIVLGASITTGSSGANTLTVPSFPYATDPTNNNSAQINGLGVGDTIVFTVGGTTYTRLVTAVSNPGTPGGTATITFDGTALVSTAPAGTPVYEQQTVNVNVLPGTVVVTGTNITVDVQAVVHTVGVADVTVNTSPALPAPQTPNTWSTPSPTINMTKYVRNLTAAGNPASGGTPTSISINGATNTYYRSGVTGNKGDVLEYVVVAQNTAATAAGDLSNCALSDLLPTAFVTFLPNQYGAVGKDIFYIDQTGTSTTLTVGVTGQATYIAANNPNLAVNVGQGADATHTGTLPHGASATIAYQVTIK
jgi:hypothetical protein